MGRFIRVTTFAFLFPLTFGVLLGAQSPPERPRVDSLLTHLDNLRNLSNLPEPSACQADKNSLGRLCGALIATRKAELTADVNDINQARQEIERVVDEQPKWAIAWYALGRVRLAEVRAGLPSHEGPLQIAGTPNGIGAAAVFERALMLEPDFGPAANTLASSPVAFTDKKTLKARVALLRRYRNLLSDDALIDEALFELDAGSADTAVTLLHSAISSGSDDVRKGYAQITLARALYRINRPKDGRAALFAGASETDSAGLAEYQEQISWVGDSTDMKTWNSLRLAARPAWLAAFWAKRDAREGRGDGERLIEHYRRVNYAYEHYRMVLNLDRPQNNLSEPSEASFRRWLTERADSLYRLPPSVYSAKIDADTCPLVNWGNPPQPPGMVQQLALDTLQKFLDYAMVRTSLGAESPFRAFQSNQRVLDDRGLVYIRHGEPTTRAEATPGTVEMQRSVCHRETVSYSVGTGAIAVWRYDRPAPQPPLILYFVNKAFQGTTEPNVLVPTLLAEDPQTRYRLCGVDPSICPRSTDLADEIKSDAMSMDKVGASRLLGLAEIKDAVTTDAYPRTFTKAVHPSIEMHALDLAQGGSPRLVAGFSIPGNELTRDTTKAKGSIIYPVLVSVIATRESDGKRVEFSSMRTPAMSHVLGKGEYFSGLIELPLSPGQWTATLILTQPDGRGAVATTEHLIAPEWSLKLKLSEIVLGREDDGPKWNSGPGGQQVALNPLNTFPVGGSASIYAQISGLVPGESYAATIEVFEGTSAKGTPALTIALPETADASRAELSRRLGLTNLKAGKYLMRLTIRSGGEEAVSTAGLEIVR